MIGLLLIVLLQTPSLPDIYKAADADMQAQRWQQAADKYDQILQEDPTHVPSLFNLAVCSTNLGNIQRAADLYTRLLEEDGSIYEARVNLALTLEKLGNRTGAAEQVDKAVALRPNDPDAHMFAATFFITGGDADRAAAHMLAAEAEGRKTPELYLALNQIENQRNNPGKAREYLEKAAALAPPNRTVQRQLGAIYLKAGEFPKAIAALLPLLPETRVELAQAYYSNRNFAEAAALLTELSRTEPNNADYLFMLGTANFELKHYALAIPTLLRTVELNPKDVDAYWTLGATFTAQENWSRAAEALSKVIELQPKRALAHFVLATCLDHLKKYKEALLQYNQFLALDDGSNDTRSFQARQRAKTLKGK